MRVSKGSMRISCVAVDGKLMVTVDQRHLFLQHRITYWSSFVGDFNPDMICPVACRVPYTKVFPGQDGLTTYFTCPSADYYEIYCTPANNDLVGTEICRQGTIGLYCFKYNGVPNAPGVLSLDNKVGQEGSCSSSPDCNREYNTGRFCAFGQCTNSADPDGVC